MKGKSEYSTDVTATGDVSHHFRKILNNKLNNFIKLNHLKFIQSMLN